MTQQTERLNAALAGRYRIERHVGEGGMATVYLCEDLKHDRKVALKLLKPELAAVLGAERFVQEIKTTAALQHPHILPLFDSGVADGFLFYVMPFIDGETLRAKLDRETQLGVDEAVRIAREAADALDYAHQRGIVHRDIKPENILLHGGHALIADFGIALAVSAAAGGRMTETGLSLGTPHYMSPEQATAEKEITPRSDIYSLGSVLYEMLTGNPPHVGSSAQQIIMRIITDPVRPVSDVRKAVPANVAAAVIRSLEKLPADRFESAKAFGDALGNPAFHTLAGAGAHAPAAPRRSRVMGAAGWAVAAIMALAAGWQWRQRRAEVEPEQPTVRATLPVRFASSNVAGLTPLAISANGSLIAYRGTDSAGAIGLFYRALGTSTETRINDLPTAGTPFFAMDGSGLGYTVRGMMRVQTLEGGGTRDLIAIAGAGGITAAWGADGYITIANGRALIRVRATGGKPDTVLVSPEGERLLQPSLSPDGRTVFCARLEGSAFRAASLVALRLDTRKVIPLGIIGFHPVLVGEHTLTYATAEGTLYAVSFNLGALKAGTDSRVLAQGISLNINGIPRVAVAPRTGTAVFLAGSGARERELALLDRGGRARVVVPESRAFRYPRFSPDGQRIAVGTGGSSGPFSGDVWIATLATGGLLRVTTDTISYHPEWEADGRHLLVIKGQPPAVPGAVYRVAADGTSPATRVVARPHPVFEAIPLAGGRGVIFREDADALNRDIYATAPDSGAAPVPLAATRFDEKGIALAPDGKWFAYTSNESGANEVYIRRVAPESPRWAVSRGGGNEPRWSKSGEVFFRRGDSVYVSRVVLGAEPQVAAPAVLFGARFDATTFEPMWDVSPDGTRFVVTRAKPGADDVQLTLLVNAVKRRR
ncbi:MAG: protein kinase [Gemmatimonadales bacterium]